MFSHFSCTLFIAVLCLLLYSVYCCTLFIAVLCLLLYSVYRCTLFIAVLCLLLYSVYYTQNTETNIQPHYVSVFGGITPLHHAVLKNDLESAKVLLNWSCDLYRSARMFKYNYDTLYDTFELAIHNECAEMALLLAQAGYNVSKINYITDYSAEVPNCLKNRPDILQILRESVLSPMTLFDTAVMVIRQALRNNISHQADCLPLPKLLIEDVKLRCILG